MSRIKNFKIVNSFFDEDGRNLLKFECEYPNDIDYIKAYAKMEGYEIPLKFKVGGRLVTELTTEDYIYERLIYVSGDITSEYELEIYVSNSKESEEELDFVYDEILPPAKVLVILNEDYNIKHADKIFDRVKGLKNISVTISTDSPLVITCEEEGHKLIVDGEEVSLRNISKNSPFSAELRNVKEVYLKLNRDGNENVEYRKGKV